MNVARRNVVRAIQTQRTGSMSSSSTKKIAETCAKVFALPKMLGRKSRSPAIMKKYAADQQMEISRLNTITVYFQGIMRSIESTRNMVLISSLSRWGRDTAEQRLLMQRAGEQAVEAVAPIRQERTAPAPT